MATGALEYKVEDRSILLPYYRRFLVDPLLPLLPARLNPNAITHAGHLLNLSGAVLLLVLWPKRGWPFFAAMVLLQIYMWCDNADGAHARRTNQCSALGEFLDHGLDQLNTVYIAFLSATALGMPPAAWVAIATFIPAACAATYWEQSTTGVFRVGALNQVESVTVLSIALTTSAVFGTSIWTDLALFGITAQRAMVIWVVGTILFGIARGIQRVVAMKNGLGPVLPIVPFVAFNSAVAIAAQRGAINTIPAVTLTTAANVYFGMRMLTLRLHGKAPRVEASLVAFVAIIVAFAGWHELGHAATPLEEGLLATFACVVFGAQAIQDTRKSLVQIAR